ncbi:DUF4230 domain-containing protein [Sporosarcina contaminans]|uniref:DUF4230 domain-containing protein n=1 Tax=Sporosarcina contaminans TaxID=633403 RepID=A0ABW3U1V7_9BACL
MKDHNRSKEHKKAMSQLEASKKESAVTFEEVAGRRRRIWRPMKIFSTWRKSMIVVAILLILFVLSLPFLTFKYLTLGSTYTEQKGVFLERIQDLKEIATAEAYTKVIIERQDNQLFGQDIGMDLPGTKRQLLVVVPGSVKAGVDLSGMTEQDIVVDENKKTVKLTLPTAEFLGGAEIYFDQIEMFSYEGLLRSKADIQEGYEIADEAKELIMEEAAAQGVLDMARYNAEKTLKEMFSFAGYDVTIEFKE